MRGRSGGFGRGTLARGYGMGLGRGAFGRGAGAGGGYGWPGNPYPYCRYFPWLPRRWWSGIYGPISPWSAPLWPAGTYAPYPTTGTASPR